MNIIEDEIVTSQDHDSETICFRDYTPHRAYDKLTDAVYSALCHPDYVQININAIPPNTKIGTAKYDKDADSVIELSIDELILEDYGVEK